MAVSLESYMLINFTMNVITIGAVARSRGSVRWGRVVFAAAFGALYAVAMNTQLFSQLRWLPAQAVLPVVLTLVAVKVESAKELATGTLMLVGGTALLGGIQYLVIRFLGRSAWAMALGALAGGIALVAALEARGRRMEKWEVQVLIRRGSTSVKLNALIDTGNRLHEPLSGLPVLVVEHARVERLLPREVDPARPEPVPPGFRLVAYGGLGGGGQMLCFRPDELLASYGEGWMRAPDVWVAVYPGRMPGVAHALAPTVIGCIQPAGRRGTKSKSEGSRYEWLIPRSK